MFVLYNPFSTSSGKHPLPMALLAVASMLEGELEFTFVDGNLEADPVERILELGRRHKLTAVALSVMPGPQLERAIPHSRRIKQELPDVPLVWGGYFPSQHYETVLADGSVDVCVRGQGEQTFLELARVLAGGGDLSAIQGISYRLDGSVYNNSRREVLPLEDFPDWPYHRVPMERYFHSHYLGKRVATHQSSYGCPFACNFCAIVSIVNRRWVAQSPERIIGVLRYMREQHGADAVQFHDMDFFVQEKRTVEFAERAKELDLKWWALGRVDELMRYKDSTWSKMRDSGLKMIYCGAEAGSADVLERMNKGGKVTPDSSLELVRRMKEYGIVPELSFVLGNPPDPMADIEDTIRFIRRIKEINPATEVILYMYTPVPQDGTLLEEAQALGFRFPGTLDGWISGDWRDFSLRRDPQNPWLNPRLQRRVRNFERVLNAYYPTTTDLRLRGLKRLALKALSGWRYKTGVYTLPLELRVFHRLFQYQRPETSGF